MRYMITVDPFEHMVRAYGTFYLHQDGETGMLVYPNGISIRLRIDAAMDNDSTPLTDLHGTLVTVFGRAFDDRQAIRVYHIDAALPRGCTQPVVVYAYRHSFGWRYSRRHDVLPTGTGTGKQPRLIPLGRDPNTPDASPWGWRFQRPSHRLHKWFYTRRPCVIARDHIRRVQPLYIITDLHTPRAMD